MTENAQKAEKIQKSEEEWRQQLTPEQYYVTREKGLSQRFPARSTKTTMMEAITAWLATRPYSSPIPSLNRARAGQVSGSRFRPKLWRITKT